MAFGSAEIGTTELALAAADKPMLIGRNWLRYTSGAAARWTAGTWTTDQSETGFDASRGYDGYDHLTTKPSGTGYPYYVINLGSGVGEIDCVALLNHNALTAGATTIDVDFCTDQDGLFTPAQQAYSAAPADDNRLILIDLDHAAGNPRRYTEVQYLRIGFPGVSTVPIIGEVIIGRRRQLKHCPNMPWDDRNFRSSTDRFESASGIVTEYVHHKKRRKISAVFSPYEDSYVDDFQTFWMDDLDGGTEPFLFLDTPNADANEAYWMRYENPELISPLVGYTEREIPIIATEHGPNFKKLES